MEWKLKYLNEDVMAPNLSFNLNISEEDKNNTV